MSIKYTIVFLFLVVLQTSGMAQTTWYVDKNSDPGPWEGTKEYPFCYIQDGIDVASDGDTVLVMPGIFMENINFFGKAITVKSSGGPEVTTIDGADPINPDRGSVVIFENGEGLDSIIDGFNIQGGTGTLLYEYGDYCGGGIICYYSSPTIINSKITENSASKKGGGICCECSSPMIANNLIARNSAGSGGGGIHCKYYSPTIIDNIISENSAFYGSGIYCSWSSAIITNNILSNNIAFFGGGITCYDSCPAITNNTIYGNLARNKGGGLFLRVYSYPIVSNTILWNNDALDGPEISILSKSRLSISYSDVDGGQASVFLESGSSLNWGAGMLNEDPLFVDSLNSDFHLLQTSPCVDTGDPNSEMLEGTTSIDGAQDQGIVDLGYHYKASFNWIEATVALYPKTLNLKSKGKWVTCYIELPEGYDVYKIDISTVNLGDFLPAEERPTEIADYDDDGIADLKVKFNREDLIQYLLGSEEELAAYGGLTIYGTLYDGTHFEGKGSL